MPLRTYLVSVGLNAGLTLVCTLPLVLVALWRSRTRRWGLVLFVGSLVVLFNAVAGLPLLATMLAAIGLAGLTGYTVSQRTREIGVRIALGADRPRVVRAVVRPLAFPVAAGMVSGMLIAGVISTVLRNNLSSLRPADPLAYFMAIGMFVFVIALAVSVPARRAVRIQPAEALRHE